METLIRDIRYAVRGLRRTPGFTLVVALTLALGIGANTAIFSVVDQLLLRPLPYPDDDQLVRIYESEPGESPGFDVSPANWLDWQRQSRRIRSFAAWQMGAVTLSDGAGEVERVRGLAVSAEFFPLLGVPPQLGRVIAPEHDVPNAPLVAVISYSLWQRRFAGDPGIVGRVIELDETPAQVIGVMPAGFRFASEEIDLWAPFRLDRSAEWRGPDRGRFIWVVARLQPGVTLADAQSEMAAIAERLAQTHEFNRGTSVELVPLREELVGDLRGSLLVLYGAVGILLSIACLNVANLLVARSAARRREMAVRMSIGAGRARIVRQLLVESLMLAVVGGALGLLLADSSLRALLQLTPGELIPPIALRLDLAVVLYALGLTAVTGVVVGLMPAIAATRGSLATCLRSSTHTVSHRARLRPWLLVGQVAMTVILLCGAGLFIRTVVALNDQDAGFDRQSVLTMEVNLPGARFGDGRAVDFMRQARERVLALPGATSAAAAFSLPVTGGVFSGTGFHVRGQPELPGDDGPSTGVRVVTPDYFRTLGIPVIRGREFMEVDQAPNAEPVFVVNQAFASSFLQGQDPLGTSVSVNVGDSNPYGRIIGVVGDVSEGSLRNSARPTVFYNHGQMPIDNMVLLLRASEAGSLSRAAADAIRQLDPGVAVSDIRTIEAVFGESIAREQLTAVVSTTFALSGLLLASLGLYGLLAFSVAERTKEIGIRIALGARLASLLSAVLGDTLRLVAVGVILGVAGAIVVSRSLGSLFYGVSAYDPWTYAAVVLLLGLVAAAATLVPARRAAGVDPAIALRAD